ncbi:zinc ABC transporter substrate-binding protein [Arthrobacter sp. I2-34]|uniref:Zinc ABC transporter substrate-binding protein n=1 Tax=Arthrobacter hankyongi TaxID=2904801 RepID=A0ABS9LBY6_9MICC|nr:zinc ABC transporter substrate-binding protein [Arthrobacter hankyongi]MCG2623962.1 zinc ABC transporter substrate-binding protein [Arthrobacter hankyongi]
MRSSRFPSLVPGFPGVAGAALLSLLLAGCASSGTGPGSDTASGGADGRISIVASTNVYGDIAAAIGGDSVEVTSLIQSPAQDPHSYEASARDKLAVSQADLVIENGGGYDAFMPALVDGTGKDPAAVISAVEISGLDPDGGQASGHTDGAADHTHTGFNEHVWYDLATAGKVADTVANKLAALDPGQAAGFERNAAAFHKQLAGLEADSAALAKQVSGEAVAATDPVPLHLFEKLGLRNLTPEDFLEAAEEGSDAAPAALKQTEELATSKSVRFLAYNEQTEGAQTRQVREAAQKAGTPVVNFAETLPEGTHYADWMKSNLQNIAAATGSTK